MAHYQRWYSLLVGANLGCLQRKLIELLPDEHTLFLIERHFCPRLKLRLLGLSSTTVLLNEAHFKMVSGEDCGGSSSSY